MTYLYSSVGETLTQYQVDVDRGALRRAGSIALAAPVQYCWRHPARSILYVVSGQRGLQGAGVVHRLDALRIGADGALSPHGKGCELPMRPLHVTVDHRARHLLAAYNEPAGLSVHRIADDGSIGDPVPQSPELDFGIFPHQIRMVPGCDIVILVTRGNDAHGEAPEDPGALKVFRFTDGRLTPLANIAPGGGYGFGPRHVDFNRDGTRLYVSLERQNRLQMFELEQGVPGERPVVGLTTLAAPERVQPRQLAGTVHVHPAGHTVYVANRADRTHDCGDGAVFAGGENSIAVFRLDPLTGEPTLVQHADPQTFHVRTFALDPTGRLLVAASIMPMRVQHHGGIRMVSAGLSVFRVAEDGRLEFLRQYDVETAGKTHFWMGMV